MFASIFSYCLATAHTSTPSSAVQSAQENSPILLPHQLPSISFHLKISPLPGLYLLIPFFSSAIYYLTLASTFHAIGMEDITQIEVALILWQAQCSWDTENLTYQLCKPHSSESRSYAQNDPISENKGTNK